jgi:hypothetical protein
MPAVPLPFDFSWLISQGALLSMLFLKIRTSSGNHFSNVIAPIQLSHLSDVLGTIGGRS